jgi:hypothetical protein
MTKPDELAGAQTRANDDASSRKVPERESVTAASIREQIYNGNQIDYSHWVARMPRLSASQFAGLANGLDPKGHESFYSALPPRTPGADYDSYFTHPGERQPLRRQYESANDIIEEARSQKIAELTHREWLSWAKNYGRNVHRAYEHAVEEYEKAAPAETKSQSESENMQLSPVTPPATPPGEIAAIIIDKFHLGPEWKERLRKAPSGTKYKYLAGTWTKKGVKGGDESLFSPARIGAALVKKEKKARGTGKNYTFVGKVITRSFPHYEAEWDDIVERDRLS